MLHERFELDHTTLQVEHVGVRSGSRSAPLAPVTLSSHSRARIGTVSHTRVGGLTHGSDPSTLCERGRSVKAAPVAILWALLAAVAVLCVLLAIALIVLVLMHSGRDTGFGGMGSPRSLTEASTSSSAT